MVAVTLLLVTLVGFEAPLLPQRFGDFKSIKIEPSTILPADPELYGEYGWQTAHRVEYKDGQGRRMIVDAFRFSDTEGAHAAYLSSRPAGGVSPMIWGIDAVTGGGVTVMEFGNYVLRFHGALPGVSSALQERLRRLPMLAQDDRPWDISGRYVVPLSTRAILGPVSLNRFAPKIPPSVAAFRLGAKVRTARFEAPAGAMTVVVFEYPASEIAQEQAGVLRAWPGTFVGVDRNCVGVVLEVVEENTARDLLQESFCGPVAISFQFPDESLTLSGGLGVALWGFAVGAVIAGVRRSWRNANPIPDRTVSLKL